MSEIKHTPPELEAEGPYVVAIRGSVSYQVADCTISQHGEAYARLFAASQKMRAALKLFIGDGNNQYTEIERMDIARAALAAAEGRTEEKGGASMHPLVAGILVWAAVDALLIWFVAVAGEQERRRK